MSTARTLTRLPRVPSAAICAAFRLALISVAATVGVPLLPAAEEGRSGISPDGLPSAAEAGARAQLMRKWDLNADGRIDEGEAEIARARMKRERREMHSGAGSDPLTGRPRSQKNEAASVAEELDGHQLNEVDEPQMPAEIEGQERRLPGTTSPRLVVPVPTPKPPMVGSPREVPRTSVYAKSPGAAVPSPFPQAGSQVGLGARAGWTGRWSQPFTGGSRAGAPAAAAGYGAAGPARDLNAGRYREELPSLKGLTPRLDVTGGLLPSVRPPRQPAASPVAPLVKPPRVTAEDIGGF